MATPLYKRMKSNGTTSYSFPSSSLDFNLSKTDFNKFILLNLPKQVVIKNGSSRVQEEGTMNFDKSSDGTLFFNFEPGQNGDIIYSFGEQIVESLRNYVANYDEVLHDSRININTDFYNINEKTNPTEMIFWKWCRKLNLLDLEPAKHKIDWDKNLPDFDNNNGSGTNFFQKYLWKEREIIEYNGTVSQSSGNKAIITLDTEMKLRNGDYIYVSGDTSGEFDELTPYKILSIEYGDSNTITLDKLKTTSLSYPVTFKLKYNKLIQYIGEVQAVSKIQTSKNNYIEITAQIPHHAGSTPTILFDITDNTNYYPNLEMPILPSEQQVEIVGAENSNSPIRTEPSSYPGSHYGYYDTSDKTYKCSNGDKTRKFGDYYGILSTNNIGMDAENYFERLNEFDSSNIDGLKIDFDTDHYYKMNLPEYNIKNFDDFNSAYFDSVPVDFEFNTILWYYDIKDSNGNINSNLYCVEFLNNPDSDDDSCDMSNQLITPYKKKVSNGEQDGLSYTFTLNTNYNIDNEALPLTYDPATIYAQNNFDLYQNILNSNAKLQDNFLTIISGFTYINQELMNMKSVMYSQTDINRINSDISNLNDLLRLYSTMQFTDSDSALIETNFEGSYPVLKFNVVKKQYEIITNINASEIFSFNELNNGNGYTINVPLNNQLMINIFNDNNSYTGNAVITLNRDLVYKQGLDIFIAANNSASLQYIDFRIMATNGTTITEQILLSNICLPVDLVDNIDNEKTNSVFTNSNTVLTASKEFVFNANDNTVTLYVKDDVFGIGDYVYIDNFYFGVTDYSSAYKVIGKSMVYDYKHSIMISMNTNGAELRSNPKISYYRGIHINVLRVSSLDTNSLTERYKITKELI